MSSVDISLHKVDETDFDVRIRDRGFSIARTIIFLKIKFDGGSWTQQHVSLLEKKAAESSEAANLRFHRFWDEKQTRLVLISFALLGDIV